MDNGTQSEAAGAAGDVASKLEERFGPPLEQARERLLAYNQRAVRLMRENPGTALLCAVGLGFLIGRLASRR